MPNPSFCWQDKATLRRIRESCENYHSALGVYMALTVVASDKEADTFETTHEWLGQLSGYDRRTVIRRLRDLQQIGVVKVSTPRLKAPSTYQLIRCAMKSQRSDTKSQRCDTERPVQSHTSEGTEGKKEDLPSANGKRGLVAQFEEKFAENLNRRK
jgi:hypothetical protein